ncbi:MAG TPA: DEAD/DEAH box helicase, partial [Desulfocapsa sulfexigens]|nr:DEAD/DEAH box helicase [Desulfocapsa sulfexigens]
GLHRIQQQAIEPILSGRDLIIQSATGSGKTEAVLAPCLEEIIASGREKSALYIVPTRALAFDIRRRFANILKERLGIHLAIRTGDMKTGGGGRPDIILTTPESLDVMLGSGNADLKAFILRVQTIIIDEVHPFVHQYRGQQLFWLMHRLQRRTRKPLQKIAISATIADPDEVYSFFGFQADYILLSENVSREIHPRLIHLKNDEDELISLFSDLSVEWKYNKILIFANSRGRCDKIFGLLNRQGAFKGNVLLHYSNLNTRERQMVEHKFRNQSRAVCIATSTLELGIDVGDVDAVLLFEPPDSVSAFLQRIGRANRRRNTIHFWGICRGELAGVQLLRFLALVRLAGEGRVESALSGKMPSVLSQQFISCLYEKKQLSLAALKDLFTTHLHGGNESEIEQIFSALLAKNWLKKSSHKGLFQGGYHYWKALLEYSIWSNFPENEDQYQLLVEKESVADIPKSVVKQLEPGDRVLLAGRRLKILWIDEDKSKRVVAEPCRNVDNKDLVWLGKGGHVTCEVAQAMQMVLKDQTGEQQGNGEIAGLFSRTRALLRQEFEIDSRAVILDNTIAVVRLPNGLYQYRTFIGAMGNLILATAAKEYFAELADRTAVQSDEMGLTCSRQIRFEKLNLPLTAGDFASWIRCHFKMMAAMYSMNTFCITLPVELLCLELTGFIQDSRLLDFFTLCKTGKSAIVEGDPANLNLKSALAPVKVMREIPSQSESLLELEKTSHPHKSPPLFHPDGIFQAKALSGTLVGEYFRHQQCHRWLCLQFYQLQGERGSPKETKTDSVSALRIAKGIAFEEKIIKHLHSRGKIRKSIPAQTANNDMRSLDERFRETVEFLQQLTREKESKKDISEGYIVHPVLHLYSAISLPEHKELPLSAIGIPDLIQLRTDRNKKSLFLRVGDIKSSTEPRYYQKWQVAFYAWILKQQKLVQCHVADSGFILTPSGDDELARRHIFDLAPYLASMEAVLTNIKHVLSCPPWKSFWQIKRHCCGCSAFSCCYEQAIDEEDIQFIPGISRDALLKLRSCGIRTLQQEIDFTDYATVFTAKQKHHLQSAMTALRHNTILLGGTDKRVGKTDLFPANISRIFVIHLVVEPVSAQTQTIGLVLHQKGHEPETFRWDAHTDSE